MLYMLERGEVITKPGALDRSAEALPAEWHDLIRQVRQDRNLPWNAPARPGSIERAIAFVEYVRTQTLDSR